MLSGIRDQGSGTGERPIGLGVRVRSGRRANTTQGLPARLVLRPGHARYLRIEGTVSGFEELEVFAREAAPTVARGNNLVAVMPPSPAYAGPVIAALLGRLADGHGALLL